MKKPKKIKYRQIKKYKDELDKLGDDGWKLIAVDEGEGVFMLEEPVVYEYRIVRPDLRLKREMNLQEIVDEMVANDWQLASVFQGPRAFDAALIFEREIAS